MPISILNDLESRDTFVSASNEVVNRNVSSQELLDMLEEMMEEMEKPPVTEAPPVQQQVPVRKENKPSVDYLAQLEALKKTQAQNVAVSQPKEVLKPAPPMLVASENTQSETLPANHEQEVAPVPAKSPVQDSIPTIASDTEPAVALSAPDVPVNVSEPIQDEDGPAASSATRPEEPNESASKSSEAITPVSEAPPATDRETALPKPSMEGVNSSTADEDQTSEIRNTPSEAVESANLPSQDVPVIAEIDVDMKEANTTEPAGQAEGEQAESSNKEIDTSIEPAKIDEAASISVAAATVEDLQAEEATSMNFDPPSIEAPMESDRGPTASHTQLDAPVPQSDEAQGEDVHMSEPTSPLSTVSSDLSAVQSDKDQGPARRRSGRSGKLQPDVKDDKETETEDKKVKAAKGKPTCDVCDHDRS